MTDRKPFGMKWESWVERRIREAQEQGEFDNLPGAGKPIPDLNTCHDPNWWVKKLIKRENLNVLPDTLAARLDVERGLERVWSCRFERDARKLVALLNSKILQVNSQGASGPSANLSLLDTDAVLKEWRNRR